MTTPSIIMIIPYFGKWPQWFNHFLISCQYNSSINWLFFTDCGIPKISPENTTFIEMSFSEYKKIVSEKLNIDFHRASPYKLCDIKPAYGYIHEQFLDGYDFFGFGDIDVIYGDLRSFLKNDILINNQLISTHSNRISGHFCLLKNNALMRNAFKKIPHWEKLFENSEHLSVDESKFTKVFIPHRKHPPWLKKLYSLFSPYWRNNFFKEQYSTILSPIEWIDGLTDHPHEWYWHNGKLTNNNNGNHEFMYLHFMNWKSNRWLPKEHGKKSLWSSPNISYNFNFSLNQHRFIINKQGFHDTKD